jgi:uncharacterized protein YndB with AHSA1/START domain
MSTAGSLGVTTITTPSDLEIGIKRVVNAPRKLVFEAWTNPELMPKWMLGPEGWTLAVCEIDPRPGGACRNVWRGPEGAEMVISGVYKEVVPPERLVHTECFGPDWPESLETMILSEHEGKTTISITLLYPSKDARDRALETGLCDGQDAMFDSLERFLSASA